MRHPVMIALTRAGGQVQYGSRRERGNNGQGERAILSRVKGQQTGRSTAERSYVLCRGPKDEANRREWKWWGLGRSHRRAACEGHAHTLRL